MLSPEDLCISRTDYNFPGQTNVYKGKVRDVYMLEEKLIMIASDRISAFDHVLPKSIPFKGQVLNKLAAYFLDATKEIVPNWLEAIPHPNVAIGKKCIPFRVEMVIRNFLVGHAWREYSAGKRMLCGVQLPEGMVKNQQFQSPIITPSTKEDTGHDMDISREEIISQNIISEADYIQLEAYTYALFDQGSKMADDKKLILVDTKYEFGKIGDKIILIDEIHTPDSSRYFMKEGYAEQFENGLEPKQLSKEFVREWLMDHGFQGLEDQLMPIMPDSFVELVSARYIELYEMISGKTFEKKESNHLQDEIEQSVMSYLNS